MRLKVYCRVNVPEVDENGNPAAVGLCVDLGEVEKDIKYEELAASINKERLLELACLEGIVKPEDVEIITPEEYGKEYGADEEKEAE